MLLSFVAVRGTGFRVVEVGGGPFVLLSKRFSISFTLGCFPANPVPIGEVGLAFPSAGLSLIGADADRYDEGFKLLRAAESGGCLGVVPLPFDLKDDGEGRASEGIAAMPFDVMSV